MQLKNVALTAGIAILAATSIVSAGIAWNAQASSATKEPAPGISQDVGKQPKPVDTPLPGEASSNSDQLPAGNGGTTIIYTGSEGGSGSSSGGSLPLPEPTEPVPPPPPVEPPPPVVPPVTPTPQPQPEPENPGPVLEVVRPKVTSASPSSEKIGVPRNTKIVVTFSHAMDKASAQQAFYIVNPNTGNAGNFSWDAAGKVMTFTPSNLFAYGKDVSWQVGKTAKNTEGVSMEDDFVSNFRVIRSQTVSLSSQDNYDGTVFLQQPGVGVVDASGTHLIVGDYYRSFVSFNLSLLPKELTKITGATLSVYQSGHHAEAYGPKTGKLMAQSLTYGALSGGDWDLKPHEFCFPGCVPLQFPLSTTATDGWKSVDMTTPVTADWNLRAERGSRSQFRLQFEKIDVAPGTISAKFHSGENASNQPVLKVTFEIP